MRRLWPVLVAALSFACANANPVATASRAAPENKAETVAFALHNSYVVVAEAAASIAEQPTTPREVKKALVNLHESASPAVKKLHTAAVEYTKIREAVQAGTGTADKLARALAALNEAINNAAPKIDALAREVGGT